MSHPDLDDLNERTDRMLDGMSVNRQKLARDVRAVSDELRRWRDAHARLKADGPKREGFAGAFDDLFGGIHKGGK